MSVTNTPADRLTMPEVIALLQCSERTVRRYISNKQLPARRVRGHLEFDRADVEKLIAGEPVKPGESGAVQPTAMTA